MKPRFVIAILLAFLTLLANGVAAEQDLVQTVAEGCKTEMESYCTKVTPGQGRILACLYAHGDKLSAKCEYALFDAAVQLERAVAAMGYVANECDADLDRFCGSVEVGEGRLLQCLEKNDKQVSGRCKAALKEVGLK
jgi:hypothetical protein